MVNIEITSWKVRFFFTSSVVEQVSFLTRIIGGNKNRTKHFPCCNVFISKVLRFFE